MKNDEILKKIEKVREIKEDMKGSYFFTPPSSRGQKNKYEENKTVEELKCKGIIIYTSCSCSCKNVYFSSTSEIDLKRIEIYIRFNKLLKLKKSEAEKKFLKLDNPNNYKFLTVWSNLKRNIDFFIENK